jgi:GDPmannose 4,6-dehydratase
MPKRALITGVTGQDGAYLSQLLLEQGYEVHGTFRRSSSPNLWRLESLGIASQIRPVPLDLLEFSNILKVIDKVRPAEVYNLASQSFVGISFEQPLYTADVDALGVARLLEAIRTVDPGIRFYQASTSEMFGRARGSPQNEETSFYPRSPYGVAKVFAHWTTVNYRESYGLHASSGILFNHESPLRGLDFVTRKITSGLARIRHGQLDVLELGNLEARRDWGFAGDYVRGMWLMVQQERADDYLLATGEVRTVREFVDCAAQAAGFALVWEGSGEAAHARDRVSGKVVVRVNKALYRPAEIDVLTGTPAKAERCLNWRRTTSFAQLIEMMVKGDCDRAAQGLLQR